MALNSSGPISLAGTTAGQSIEIELGGTGSTQISLNDTSVRTLAGVPSGAIIMPTNFWGKANSVNGWFISTSASQYNITQVVPDYDSATTGTLIGWDTNYMTFQSINLTTGALSSNTWYTGVSAASTRGAIWGYKDASYGKILAFQGSLTSSGPGLVVANDYSVADYSANFTAPVVDIYGTFSYPMQDNTAMWMFGTSSSSNPAQLVQFTYAGGSSTTGFSKDLSIASTGSFIPAAFAVSPDQTKVWGFGSASPAAGNKYLFYLNTSTGTITTKYELYMPYANAAALSSMVSTANNRFYLASSETSNTIGVYSFYQPGTNISMSWGYSINTPSGYTISTSTGAWIRIFKSDAFDSLLVVCRMTNTTSGFIEMLVFSLDASAGTLNFAYRIYNSGYSIGSAYTTSSKQVTPASQTARGNYSNGLAMFPAEIYNGFVGIFALPFRNAIAAGTYSSSFYDISIASITLTQSSRTEPTTASTSVTTSSVTNTTTFTSLGTSLTNTAITPRKGTLTGV